MALTIEAARRMIMASQAKARELGVAVSTAIVDAEGRLFAFERMEGSRWISVEVSQAKAYTGALLGRDGPNLAQMTPASLAALSAMHHHALMPNGSVTTLREGTCSSPGSAAAVRPTSRTASVHTRRATRISHRARRGTSPPLALAVPSVGASV
jgi:glc operon protein GlcG